MKKKQYLCAVFRSAHVRNPRIYAEGKQNWKHF